MAPAWRNFKNIFFTVCTWPNRPVGAKILSGFHIEGKIDVWISQVGCVNSRKCNHILHINETRDKSAKFRTFIHNRHYLFLSSFFFESSLYLSNTRAMLHIFEQVLFWAGNQGNHQHFDPSLLPKNLSLLFMGLSKKTFWKKKSKMAPSNVF